MDPTEVTSEQIGAWLTRKIAQLLRCPAEEVDVEMPFAMLGLDSLTTLTLTGDLAEWLGRDLSASLFLEHPTVTSLAQHLVADGDSEESRPIPKAPRGQPLPVTLSQFRILSHSQMGPEGDTNVIRRRYELKGPLNVEVLQRAFGELACRHEILRTTFTFQNGEAMQIIHPPGPVAVELTDLTAHADPEAKAIEIATTEVANIRMDLQKGPLLRVLLLKMGTDHHRLVVPMHHMLCDAETLPIFWEDLEVIYSAFLRGEPSPLTELPLQAADVGAWQRQWLRKDGQPYQNKMAQWMQHWEGHAISPLELPFRRKEPPLVRPDASECQQKAELSPILMEQIRELAHSEGATSYMVFLAAFAAALQRCTGQQDLVIGTYVSERTRSLTRRLTGVFVNLLPIRMRFEGVHTFRQALRRMRDAVAQATRCQELPLEDLLQNLSAAGKPMPEIRVIFQMVPWQRILPKLQGVETTRWETGPLRMLWGFSMTVDNSSAQAHFDGGLYDPLGSLSLLRDYKELLLQIVNQPDVIIRDEARNPVAV